MISRTYGNAYLRSFSSCGDIVSPMTAIDYTDSTGQWQTMVLPYSIFPLVLALCNGSGRVMDCNRSAFLAILDSVS